MKTVHLLNLTLHTSEDVVRARHRAKQISTLLGFSKQDQIRIATAVSEIARNAYQYAYGGKVEFILQEQSQKISLTIDISDNGPGIKELASLLKGEMVSLNGGKGVLGAQRIMDVFQIHSEINKGTIVNMAMFLPHHTPTITPLLIDYIAAELARDKMPSATEALQQQNQELLQALDLLKQAHDELEQKVEARTAELSAANKALKGVTDRLNLALTSADVGTWYWQYPKKILSTDAFLPLLFGLPHGELTVSLKNWLKYIYEPDRKIILATIRSLLTNQATTYNLEFRTLWTDKTLHVISSRGKIEHDKANKWVQITGICWDITERRQSELLIQKHQQELIQLMRVNSMGEIGSAIAHELNQPLTAVTTFTQGCIRRLESSFYSADDIIQALKIIAQQSERAGEIIHRLKNFVRKGKTEHEHLDVNTLLQTACTLFNYELYEHPIDVILDLLNPLPLVSGDQIQLEQVLLNLLRNSREAMQEHTQNPVIKIQSLITDNNYVMVKITDNGPGFTHDIAKKLLEPYFTTKAHGMGLGLSISRTIIESHGGHLKAIPCPEGGACFQFTLPIIERYAKSNETLK